ncbi:MAG: L-fuculose-phosphate aldolase [Acidimicrobiaceae bacterium]|jgi:L-fuculose-phosphate aldolase|nr:L-fuculose-phosphate aldolase [Acidimicrobiaceae bacterium]
MSDLLLADEREAVASASRHLAQRGLVIGTAGNISARKGDHVAVTPTGADLATVTAEMVTVIDLEGAVVDGDLAPTSEVPLHTGIYADTNALAITHAHAMASTALSCTHDELLALHYSCLGLGGTPRTAAYATFGSQELADNVIEALKGRNAAMMQNHGSVAYGTTMEQAIERLELLEWLAELYWRASSLGTPRVLTDKDFEAIIMSAMERGYGTTKKAIRARSLADRPEQRPRHRCLRRALGGDTTSGRRHGCLGIGSRRTGPAGVSDRWAWAGSRNRSIGRSAFSPVP